MDAYPKIPGFTCDAVLGRGGMAVVYSATDESLGRRVAIKVVTAGDSDEAQHVRRLEQEARGLAGLQHPHIVALHAFGRTREGALYYVMPRLEGGDLAQRAKPLDERELRELLDALLGALAHAHAAGIVHRDIKPANILFDRLGRPLLGDFGAAFVRGAQRITDRDMAIGSTEYMSPEQARGLAVDARSDLYSLGVLAFEYLTGRLPFQGEDDLATALAKEEQPVPAVPAAFAHWQSFFERAMAVSPDARFADAEAMRAALPLRPVPPPPAAPGRRGRAVFAVALVAVVVAVAAVLLYPAAAPPDTAVATAASPAVTPAPALSEIIPPPPTPASSPAPVAAAREPVPASRTPVTAAEYRRFLVATNRPLFDCPAAPAPAQGCITVADGERFAAWLSRETGVAHRLPTRAELDAIAARTPRIPARAWSSTCDERRSSGRQNVARRAWSGVREAFGREPLRGRTVVRCVGHYAVALDGRGGDAVALDRAGPDTVVVLVRDVAP